MRNLNKKLPNDAELRYPADLKVGDIILVWSKQSKIISIEETKKLWVFDIEDFDTKESATLVRYPDEVVVVKK